MVKYFATRKVQSKGVRNKLMSATDRVNSEINLRSTGRNQNSALNMYFNISKTDKGQNTTSISMATIKTKNLAQRDKSSK